jgi:hypothetical protein
MSQREVMIMLGHALGCPSCRSRLLNEPSAVFIGRALSQQEKEALANLTPADFNSTGVLARSYGVAESELNAYTDHPVARLRHF